MLGSQYQLGLADEMRDRGGIGMTRYVWSEDLQAEVQVVHANGRTHRACYGCGGAGCYECEGEGFV